MHPEKSAKMETDLKVYNPDLSTLRLQLFPVSLPLAKQIRDGTFFIENEYPVNKTEEWPDCEFLELLPKIIDKLSNTGDPEGFTSYLIIKKTDHTVIGDAGFKSPPNDLGEVDIGYGLIESQRKKGYATEAVKALVNWAFQHKEVKAITANCSVENMASVKLLNKLNAKQLGMKDGMLSWIIKKHNGLHF